MTLNVAPFGALAFMLGIAAAAIPSPAAAEDFTFEVPVELTNFAPGVRVDHIQINCDVWRSFPHTSLDDRVAYGTELMYPGDGPVTSRSVITLRMNATNPRLLPASEGRYYDCAFDAVAFSRPDGTRFGLFPADDTNFARDYERYTYNRLVNRVASVHGEIPR